MSKKLAIAIIAILCIGSWISAAAWIFLDLSWWVPLGKDVYGRGVFIFFAHAAAMFLGMVGVLAAFDLDDH